jgi:hypothetical protein
VSVISAPGFYPNLSPADYFAEPCPAPALTNSGIGILLGQSPAHFAAAHPAIGQPAEKRISTAAQYRGSLVHRLALDKGADWQVIDAPDYRTKAAQEAKAAAEGAGLIPVLACKIKEAEAMASVIRQRIADAVQGQPYQTEVVIAWQERGLWCRAMLDVWCPALSMAWDVKTAQDISDLAMGRAFARGYARQDAWYRRGLDAVTRDPGRNRFGFLFVEGDAPHLSRTASIDEAYRDGSDNECERALSIFGRCMAANSWPGPGHYTATPPSWRVREWMDAEIEEAA